MGQYNEILYFFFLQWNRQNIFDFGFDFANFSKCWDLIMEEIFWSQRKSNRMTLEECNLENKLSLIKYNTALFF